MMNDRSTKTLIAVFTLVAGAFLIVDQLIEEKPIEDWWLSGVLLAVSVFFWVWLWQENRPSPTSLVVVDKSTAEIPRPVIQEWIISKDTAAPSIVPPTPVQNAVTSVTSDILAPHDRAIVDDAENAKSKPAPRAKKPKADPQAAIDTTEAPAVSDDSPVAAAKDDLTRLEGIGPKYQTALNAAGIYTYEQLSNTSEKELQAAVKGVGAARASSLDTWAEQATYLVRGDMEGFNALVAKLRAGRRGK